MFLKLYMFVKQDFLDFSGKSYKKPYFKSPNLFFIIPFVFLTACHSNQAPSSGGMSDGKNQEVEQDGGKIDKIRKPLNFHWNDLGLFQDELANLNVKTVLPLLDRC